MILPNDYARCAGWGDGPEDWLEECHDCQRRTAPAGGQQHHPPSIVAFWCEDFIPPDRPEDQRLRHPTERVLFDLIGLPWTPPADREVPR
jgi:hypothetical protein